MKEPTVGSLGELVCPHCGTHILTPDGYDVVPGLGTCLFCKGLLRVTEEIAEEANHRAREERYVKAQANPRWWDDASYAAYQGSDPGGEGGYE